jgi:hypothetical protein
MSHELSAVLFTLALFFGMLVLLEVGREIGSRPSARETQGAGVVDGAVFGLLGLLVAFTFSGATSRFDVRRHLIVEEANAIGTAYLRLDLLPAEAQPMLRESFRRYVDSRLETYRKLPDVSAAREELAISAKLQEDIWRDAVTACRGAGAQQATMLLLPALNAMIDITTTRTMAAQAHPPTVVFALLSGMALASALLAGYAMAGAKSRSWLHMLSFAAAIAVAVYVILDLEYPRLGLIQVDAFDQVLVDARESMK